MIVSSNNQSTSSPSSSKKKNSTNNQRISTMINSFLRKSKHQQQIRPINDPVTISQPKQPGNHQHQSHPTQPNQISSLILNRSSSNNLSSLPLSICDEIEEEDNQAIVSPSSSSSVLTPNSPTSSSISLSTIIPQSQLASKRSASPPPPYSSSSATNSHQSPAKCNKQSQQVTPSPPPTNDPHHSNRTNKFAQSSSSSSLSSSSASSSFSTPSTSLSSTSSSSPLISTYSLPSPSSASTNTKGSGITLNSFSISLSQSPRPSTSSNGHSSQFFSPTVSRPLFDLKWSSELLQFPLPRVTLDPVIQHRGTLLKFSPLPPAGFWLQKTPKVWKSTFCCISAIFPHSHPYHDSDMTLYYLHGFSSLSPSASDLEFCRLRLEPSSVVCVLEDKLHGKSLVLKVTGQEMIGSSNSEDHQSNILSPPRMVRRQSSKKLAQLSPSQSTSIGSRPQSSSHRASSCGEVESTWLFAMEGVSHLKAWMKVLKEVVNVLKQSASLADSTPVPSRQSISNNLNISHNDLTSPGKEPSFSSGSLKKKYSNIIPLPVSSEPQMVSRDLSIDPALNPVLIDPRLISFPSLNPLLPSLDSEVAPCTSVFPIANRTQRASSQVSYAPSSSSSASTDQLICSPQTDSDQSSPTMRRSNHDHSMLTDFPERPPSSVSQRRAKDLERLRMKDDRLVTIRGPICLDDEALSPTEVSSDFNFATKQSQFRSQQVLPSLPCPPRIRSARKPGAGQGLKKSCSITSSRKNSFLSDSEPPTSPLGQHTDLNSSSHYLELHRSVQGASPIGRTGSLKGLENGSVKGLDEEISNNEEATVSALSSGEQAIRNLKLKPRSVKLPPVLVEGNGAALRKRISSTNIIAVRSNLVRRELEADKFSPVDSKSSFHTAEDIENFSQFSASDFGLLPAPEIRQDNYTVPSTPPPLAKSNHKYRADNKSKDRDENENGPNIARSASDFATPLKSSISKSSVMTLSPSSSEFRIKIRNEEIGRSLRSGSLTGSLMSMNSSHTNLSISSQTPPPPKYPPPNISLPELPRE